MHLNNKIQFKFLQPHNTMYVLKMNKKAQYCVVEDLNQSRTLLFLQDFLKILKNLEEMSR